MTEFYSCFKTDTKPDDESQPADENKSGIGFCFRCLKELYIIIYSYLTLADLTKVAFRFFS